MQTILLFCHVKQIPYMWKTVNDVTLDMQCLGYETTQVHSLAGQTLTRKERVWSNSHQAFVLHTQQQGA